MDCNICRKNAADYIEEKLPDAERQSFEGHIGECAECSRYVDNLTYTLECLHKMGREKAPAGMVDRVRARIYSRFDEEVSTSRAAAFPWNVMIFVRAAAVLFIVFLIGLFWNLTVGQDRYPVLEKKMAGRDTENNFLQDMPKSALNRSREAEGSDSPDVGETIAPEPERKLNDTSSYREDIREEYKKGVDKKEPEARRTTVGVPHESKSTLKQENMPGIMKDTGAVSEEVLRIMPKKAKESEPAGKYTAAERKRTAPDSTAPVMNAEQIANKDRAGQYIACAVRIPVTRHEEVRKHISGVIAANTWARMRSAGEGGGNSADKTENRRNVKKELRNIRVEEKPAEQQDKSEEKADAVAFVAAEKPAEEEKEEALQKKEITNNQKVADAEKMTVYSGTGGVDSATAAKIKADAVIKGGGGNIYNIRVTLLQYKRIEEYLNTIDGVYCTDSSKNASGRFGSEANVLARKESREHIHAQEKADEADEKKRGPEEKQYITIRFIIIRQPAEQPAAQEGEKQE